MERRPALLGSTIAGLSIVGFALLAAPSATISVQNPSFVSSVEAPTQPTPNPLTLLFVGDVMLDRGVALHASTVGHEALIKNVRGDFQSADLIVANLEGTVTTNESLAIQDHSILRFTSDPGVTSFLKSWGPLAVSLSNNHTDDFGTAGFIETKKNLDAAGIPYFGSPDNSNGISRSVAVEGRLVCLVGYQEFIRPDIAPIVAEIARIAPECDYLVVTMHAGKEYDPGVSTSQRTAAHAFVEAGADLVIGTHPHVVEPLELYQGKAIFYSLGNFIFDQYFSFATTHGLAVKLEWDGKEALFTLIPIRIENGEVTFTPIEEAARTLRSLVTAELSPELSARILNERSFELTAKREWTP